MKRLLFLIISLSSLSCMSQNKTLLDPVAFNDSVNNNQNAIVLDVRTPSEYSKGFILNAKNVDFNGEDFEATINKMDRDKPYFVYCFSGGRSSSAVDYMMKAGFKNIYELKQGMMGWRKENLPVTEIGDVIDKISFQEFNDMVSSGKVLIDFYAPWCGPCVKMEGMIKKLTSDFENKVKIIRVNIDENKLLTDSLKIAEIPYFKLYDNNNVIWDHVGFISEKSLVKVLEKSLK